MHNNKNSQLRWLNVWCDAVSEDGKGHLQRRLPTAHSMTDHGGILAANTATNMILLCEDLLHIKNKLML